MDRKKIQIVKGSYNSRQYKNLIDTEFKTFVKEDLTEDSDTIEELFRLYDKLYYSIPLKGANNSHEYILSKSSELTTIEKSTEEIQPFLDEIAQLRQQLLDANETIFELENNG